MRKQSVSVRYLVSAGQLAMHEGACEAGAGSRHGSHAVCKSQNAVKMSLPPKCATLVGVKGCCFVSHNDQRPCLPSPFKHTSAAPIHQLLSFDASRNDAPSLLACCEGAQMQPSWLTSIPARSRSSMSAPKGSPES